RGHRRTYIGALPGKIIQSLKKAAANNPVFLLDEVDKMSTDFRGDPSSALLEVLDPEQNHAFNDHYLDLDYDLSDVMFITTANTLHAIPPPLQDRMEIIQLPGYTEWEKLAIARQYLIPKQKEANGISSTKVDFSDEAVRHIIHHYTKEAGVRNLEREISSIARKIAKDVVRRGRANGHGNGGNGTGNGIGIGLGAGAGPGAGKDNRRETGKGSGSESSSGKRVERGATHHYRITSQSLTQYLGVEKHTYSKKEERDEIGLTNGLAVTIYGGDLLATEVTILPGKGKLVLTGKLGEVMQESAQAALSYVRSRVGSLGLDRDFYQKVDIHVHFPEGAIPKDGPSAGITMATSLVSALLRVPVRRDFAMTGEITLRGRVLPIGGLKEKILAAHRSDIFTVIIPSENLKDLKDLPKHVLKAMTIRSVSHMDEVLRLALVLDSPEEFLPDPSEAIDWRVENRPPQHQEPSREGIAQDDTHQYVPETAPPYVTVITPGERLEP
ncbi:MAG: S16 family serine protease, partial [Pseudomonadota bacterium]